MRFEQTQGWQAFQMFRGVDRDDHLTVSIALTGRGEVFLDEISVSTRNDPSRQRLTGRNSELPH
jgi:hypothetical protein